MIIEKKKISDLKPAPYNPRKSNEEQEANLKKSLEKFGVVEPIVFNKQTGYIVGGHFRIRELKKLGYKEVDCVIVDLNEDDEKELNIRLNANTGEWNWEMLQAEWDLTELEEWGLDVPIPTAEIEPIEIPDDFIDDFESQDKPTHQIATEVGECFELFLVPVSNKIDANFIRENFNLKETKQSKLIKGKSNVISIEDIKCKVK